MKSSVTVRTAAAIGLPALGLCVAGILACGEAATSNDVVRQPDDATMTAGPDIPSVFPLQMSGARALGRPRVEILNEDGTRRQIVPASHSTQPDLRSVLLTADSLFSNYRARTASGRQLVAFGRRLRLANDVATLRAVLLPATTKLTRKESESGGRVVTFSSAGKPVVRFVYPASAPLTTALSDSASPTEDCASYPVETPENDLPAECVEGYDPYWDSTDLETQLAAVQAAGHDEPDLPEAEYETDENDALNARTIAALVSRSNHAPRSRFVFASILPRSSTFPREEQCGEERAAYYAAVVAAAIMSAETLYYIGRRNPIRAWKNFKLTAAAFSAVAITNAGLKDCEEDAE